MRLVIPIVSAVAGVGVILVLAVARGLPIEMLLLCGGLLLVGCGVAWLAMQLIRPPAQVSPQRYLTIAIVAGLVHFVVSNTMFATMFAMVDSNRTIPRFWINVAAVLFFPMDCLSIWGSGVHVWSLFFVNAIIWGGAMAGTVWLRCYLRQTFSRRAKSNTTMLGRES